MSKNNVSRLHSHSQLQTQQAQQTQAQQSQQPLPLPTTPPQFTDICIGVLALQGDFAMHASIFLELGVAVQEVRKSTDLDVCDGLIIPGGESTTMLRQIDFIDLRQHLLTFSKKKPVFGTCAGLILMSRNVENFDLKPLGILDITVARNAYGRQIASFETPLFLKFHEEKNSQSFPAFFIRAPRIIVWGEDVEILAELSCAHEQMQIGKNKESESGKGEGKENEKTEPVLIRQGHHLGASFHPELTHETQIHTYFLEMVREKKF